MCMKALSIQVTSVVQFLLTLIHYKLHYSSVKISSSSSTLCTTAIEMSEGMGFPGFIVGHTDGNGVGIGRNEIVGEVKKVTWLAGPLVGTSLLLFCFQLISLMFVGHLGKLALSAASTATSFASVTGFSLLLGMSSALDTLCGQAYGAKEFRMLGVHMQRAMVVQLLLCVPLAIIWVNTGPLLKLLRQDPQISEQAEDYARFMILSLFPYGLLQCQVRFLQTQNIVIPMMFTSGITTLLHILVCWLLVFKSGLGFRGAALANGVSYWTILFLLIVYIKLSPLCKNTWTGFTKEALHDIPKFLKLAVPSALMICLETWAFMMMVLLAGLLPNPQLETSALSICLNTISALWMLPYGLGAAVSTRVSNELGAGNPRTARLAVYVVFCVVITEGIIVGSVLISIRKIWAYMYSKDVEIVHYVARMVPLLAILHILDGIQSVLSGTVRGCGRQKIGAIVNLGSYYFVGVPAAVLFAFHLHIRGMGLWLGMVLAAFVQGVSLFTICIRTNWTDEAKNARERVFGSTIPVDVSSAIPVSAMQ